MIVQNPAVLQFTINGQPLGNTFTAPNTSCTWNQFYEIWSSGSNTTAEICITNQNTQISGNIMRAGLRSLSSGTYRVRWHVLSVDTHRTEGSFTFSVGGR